MAKSILSFFLFLILLSSVSAINIYEYKSVTVEFELQKQIQINDPGENLELRFLSFRSSPDSEILFAKEEIVDSKDNKFSPEYELDKYGNRIAVFKIEDPDTNLIFTGSYKIKTNSELYFDEETFVKSNNEDFLKDSQLILTNTSNINALSSEIKSSEFYKTIYELDNWIKENIEYEIRPEFVTGKAYSSEEMFIERKGFCVEHSNLAAAILRNKGIPTRLVTGITNTGKAWGMHAWLEVKDPNGDWISYDPTYHELGFINATHIKQGIFEDYSEVKDVVKADFSLEKLKLQMLYDALNLPIEITDSEEIDSDVELTIPKEVNANGSFRACLINNNKLTIFPLVFALHEDVLKEQVDKLIYLDENYCIDINAPNIEQTTEYGYNVLYLDKNISGSVKVNGKGFGITINSIVPEIKQNNLIVNIEINSLTQSEIKINSETETQNFDLLKGLNTIQYITILPDANKITLEIIHDGKVLQEATINLPEKQQIKETNNMSYYLIAGITFLVLLAIGLLVWIIKK